MVSPVRALTRMQAKARGGRGRAYLFLLAYYGSLYRLRMGDWSRFGGAEMWTLSVVQAQAPSANSANSRAVTWAHQGQRLNWRLGLARAARELRRQARNL